LLGKNDIPFKYFSMLICRLNMQPHTGLNV
jgi:hypothetical protein